MDCLGLELLKSLTLIVIPVFKSIPCWNTKVIGEEEKCCSQDLCYRVVSRVNCWRHAEGQGSGSMVQCKEHCTESPQSWMLALPPPLATQQLGDLGHVSKFWISYLHQRDAWKWYYDLIHVTVWNSVTPYLAGAPKRRIQIQVISPRWRGWLRPQWRVLCGL